MSWSGRMVPVDGPLSPALLETLFAEQIRSWPRLRTGIESLDRARSREFDVREARIVARHIPHRMESTTAPVDPESVRRRPCFLCPENLPDPQRGLAHGEDFVVLANPFPILGRHVTVVRREHIPQRIQTGAGGDFRSMLSLARALPGFMVIYNGPECGASAPDHLHFQACRLDGVPIFQELGRVSGVRLTDDPRRVFVLAGSEGAALEDRLGAVLEALRAIAPAPLEPMVNLVVAWREERWALLVFPRARHRPEVFHQGTLTWSPGAIDLCGIAVLPVAGDLERITAGVIERVYAEVGIPAETAAAIARRLEAS